MASCRLRTRLPPWWWLAALNFSSARREPFSASYRSNWSAAESWDDVLCTTPFPELQADLAAMDAAGIEYTVDAITSSTSACVTARTPISEQIREATAKAWGLDRAKPLSLQLPHPTTVYSSTSLTAGEVVCEAPLCSKGL